MKPTSLILGAALVWLAYKTGKEAAYEELCQALGLEPEPSFEEAQRENAGLQ